MEGRISCWIAFEKTQPKLPNLDESTIRTEGHEKNQYFCGHESERGCGYV